MWWQWVSFYLIAGLLLSLGTSHTKAAKMDPRWGWGLVTIITIFWGLMLPVAIWKLIKGK